MYRFVMLKNGGKRITREELFAFNNEKIVSIIKKYNKDKSFRLTKEFVQNMVKDTEFIKLKDSEFKEEVDFYYSFKIMAEIKHLNMIYYKED